MPARNNYLVISALGQDHPGIVDKLSRSVLDNDCSIADSRMTVLGTAFAMLMLVEGPWDKVARLGDQLKDLQKTLGLTITIQRTEPRTPSRNLLPYGVDVVSLDQPGIVHSLASFFSERDINIEDMSTTCYTAIPTGAPMYSVHISVGIPGNLHIAALREDFMDFCDAMNLDAVLEPIKS